MLSAERIALKRRKRERLKDARVKSWGSVFNHRHMFPDQYRSRVFPHILPIEHRSKRQSFIGRLIKWVKSFFV